MEVDAFVILSTFKIYYPEREKAWFWAGVANQRFQHKNRQIGGEPLGRTMRELQTPLCY
jgi:hypothetical protein